jgi:hypothetical protein
MAEAFSLRTLGLLAASWERNPPFAGDAAFANAIREYRASVVAKYTKASDPAADSDLGAWFGQQRSALDSSALTEIAGPMIRRIATEFESDKACVEDLGALNRWPERSGIPIEEYLSRWQASCAEVHAAGHLPARLKTVLNLQ